VTKPDLFSKGAFYDTSAPSNDRRHEGAQPRSQHPTHLRRSSCQVREIFWQVAAFARAGRDPHLPSLPHYAKKRFPVRAQSGGVRAALSLPHHPGQDMADPAYPLRKETPHAPRRIRPGRGFPLFREHSEPETPGYRRDGLRHGPARVGSAVAARQRHRFRAHDDPGRAGKGPEGPFMGRGP